MNHKETFRNLYNGSLFNLPEIVNGINLKNRLNCCNDLHCMCKCKEFIKSWQDIYRKGGCEISQLVDKIPDERIPHTLSCFILGYTLYEKCELIHSAIDNVLKSLDNSLENSNETTKNIKEAFYFAWFLTCIYHDFGYAYEKKFVEPDDFNINELLMANICYRPNIFSNEIISRYDEYRRCRFGVKDHGIYGGVKLLKDLKEFGDKYSNFYNMAAQTIMVHNIFYCHKGDIYEPCYKGKKLTSLIVDDVMRKHIKNPFLFLLSLVDNIEPIKRFYDVEVLSKIFLDINNKDNSINISFANEIDSYKLNLYKNSVKGMTDWLTYVNEYHNELRITITQLGRDIDKL